MTGRNTTIPTIMMLKRQKDFMYGAMDFYIENYFEDDLVVIRVRHMMDDVHTGKIPDSRG